MAISDPNDPRSPWYTYIDETSPRASFVEYLRWLRFPNGSNSSKSAKLLELLQEIDNGNYSDDLNRLTKRIQRLADDWFVVVCPWRVRVGGIRGPESTLLPTFDALGLPYLPSSSLKGIARSVAERTHVSPDLIQRIFGNIGNESRVGNITFLDAYPTGKDKLGGLSSDMANAIWKWENNQEPPSYNSNPNVFLSLRKPEFVIGLRQGPNSSKKDLELAKQWLLIGLSQGIGSRVNSGYGTLQPKTRDLITLPKEQQPSASPFLRVSFELKGQLIHGSHKVQWKRDKNNGQYKPKTFGNEEVRPIAFRSMLRYWFRIFALGVFSEDTVRGLEVNIFGGIEPQPQVGLFRLELESGNSDAASHGQFGALVFRYSSVESMPQTEKEIKRFKAQRSRLAKLIQSLTWLSFHLGGVGQGARRPYYERPNQYPPCRGVNIFPERNSILPKKLIDIWSLPSSPKDFSIRFQQQIDQFYQALGRFVGEQNFDWRNTVRPTSKATIHDWSEAIDSNCVILVTQKSLASQSRNPFPKPWALQELSNQFHGLQNQGSLEAKSLSKSLCGGVFKEEIKKGYLLDRDVVSSPIWVKSIGACQIITIFGANCSPRKDYLNKIRQDSDSTITLWPPND